GILADAPPVRTSVFEHAQRAPAPSAAGLPLSAKVHASDPVVSGALADWLAGVLAVEGTPDSKAREALAPGMVLVNRDGHPFTRHTVSLYAPDAADAGLLARQAEIEALEPRCSKLASELEQLKNALESAEGAAATRGAELQAARERVAERSGRA